MSRSEQPWWEIAAEEMARSLTHFSPCPVVDGDGESCTCPVEGDPEEWGDHT